jgi:hypothetical protein
MRGRNTDENAGEASSSVAAGVRCVRRHAAGDQQQRREWARALAQLVGGEEGERGAQAVTVEHGGDRAQAVELGDDVADRAARVGDERLGDPGLAAGQAHRPQLDPGG